MTNVFSLDSTTITRIEEKMRFKRGVAQAREKELFAIFEKPMSEEEAWALKFLYAYMPLNDLADYEGCLFLSHVRTTLEIRENVQWGSRVPDHEFLHFVLPYRVNNENIEDSRGWFFGQLVDRVKNLSMEQAVLEINHWCHEKATYVGCDPRTVSPLTMVRNTLGRCGEQSTLLVAALRSLCIPARQCYTPRWAHCDSNHAWVEAWADGKWYFLGACEPEPRLNEGWFRGPAKRAMLVNTRVAANYPGPEELTLAHPWYSEINLLSPYAPSKKITIRVRDDKGNPVPGATVIFQVYNYADFSPIATIPADERGEAFLTAGLGDLLIHSVSGNLWGTKKISVKDADVFDIQLSDKLPQNGISVFDMVPPQEQADANGAAITEAEKQENNRRIQEGASIRKKYEASFVDALQAEVLAKKLSLPASRVRDILEKARGNSHEIAAFIQEYTPKYGEWTLKLLESLNVKDLTDTIGSTLADHLIQSAMFKGKFDEETFIRYILCPRVHFEMIRSYRKFLLEQFTDSEQRSFREDPIKLVGWLSEHFEIVEDLNYYQGMATPIGSFRLQKGDRLSRDILFVALARSLGIPARLEPSERSPQFRAGESWKDVVFLHQGDQERVDLTDNQEIGSIRFISNASADNDLEYFRNFSLARFENGQYKTLQFTAGQKDFYEEPLVVKSGSYRLTTGTRLPDGTARVQFAMFTVLPDKTTEIIPAFSKESVQAPVLGSVDRDMSFSFFNGKRSTLGELAERRGLLMAWIDPDREPTKHLIRELREVSKEYDDWGGSICLVVEDDKVTAAFQPNAYEGLPAKTGFAEDVSSEGLQFVLSGIQSGLQPNHPLVFVVDRECRIRYLSAGYKLGIGKEALQVVRQSDEESFGPNKHA
ncbi:transglutaminase domain-containing protein [Paenibacillus sp. V4I5]|uniref:transglutaminase domain-containing protein n=1 Tax=Paenibacillus sp. V4I5 TaxID=3042306 RepID=UPI00278F61FE|nr:transglutaminase domain-containing protein [Paenibacillus sp. V4I5]MDQ0918835.1 hypothetical protein [Paenibacillus sp. V4I5]